MAGYEDKQRLNNPVTPDERWTTPLRMCTHLAEDTARRVAASKELFPHPFFRGDFHSHTQHSDGIGTVEETAQMAKAAELDFQFVTDHWGVTQADECCEHGLWYGQEPSSRLHHLGIIGLDYAFTPQLDFLADYAELMRLGATVFIPHPAGWWPRMVYKEERKNILHELPSPFLMEICNGAENIASAFDHTDEAALQLWDELLLGGKVVHALGNTDAHAPHAIGMIWNGVFAPRCDQESVLAAVHHGHSFVSDAPLVHIALGDARMGDRASTADRKHELEVTVVDSRGLNRVEIVADGEKIFRQHFDGETMWKGNVKVPAKVEKYVRAEVHSRDARRAYSNPIYLA
jgi:hypothetical protein